MTASQPIREVARNLAGSAGVRRESDPLGWIEVPANRLYGPQTARALRNFPVSGTPVGSMTDLVVALAWVKKAAVEANLAAGELDPGVGESIGLACDEILAGRWHDEFVVDVMQGGAGTSTNMNANEVIANRALEILGHPRGRYDLVSPNDHVNRSQSTNDAYATAVRLGVHRANLRLVAALRRLALALKVKADGFADIPKLGRTQLQDAVPMTLGAEFGAFATTVEEDGARAEELGRLFLEVNLGGTAIGTGIGSSPAYSAAVIECLGRVSGYDVVRADNLLEATWDMGAFVLYSGMLKRIAAKLSKISNDLRLLSSGPRGGIGEIRLPERQPGSSLMPGKVNPVVPEAMNQIAFRVFGADTTVTFAAEAGQLQLNAFEPVIAWSLHEAASLLTAGMDMLVVNCIEGIEAVGDVCRANLNDSTALATLLVAEIGYGRAAAVAKHALANSLDLVTAVSMLEPAHEGVLRGTARAD